jgi:hypothetical protein
LLYQGVGLLRERGALVEHGFDTFMKRSNAPRFDATHLSVKFTLMRFGEGQELSEGRPTQLSPQRGDNCFVGKRFRKLHHPVKVFLFKASAEVGYQLSRQRGDNLLSVGCSFIPQDFPQDSIPYSPIERSESDVDDSCRLPASIFDQTPDLVQ